MLGNVYLYNPWKGGMSSHNSSDYFKVLWIVFRLGLFLVTFDSRSAQHHILANNKEHSNRSRVSKC